MTVPQLLPLYSNKFGSVEEHMSTYIYSQHLFFGIQFQKSYHTIILVSCSSVCINTNFVEPTEEATCSSTITT